LQAPALILDLGLGLQALRRRKLQRTLKDELGDQARGSSCSDLACSGCVGPGVVLAGRGELVGARGVHGPMILDSRF